MGGKSDRYCCSTSSSDLNSASVVDAMDLSSPKVSADDKLDLCKKYFYIGFAFLPLLWAVNAVWFAMEAFGKSSGEGEENPHKGSIRNYVVASGIGALAWIVGLVVWVVVYTQNRTAWGALGDYLSFNIPTGHQ